MTGCVLFGIKVTFLSTQQSDNALYVCNAILEEAALFIVVLEDEKGTAAGGEGKRDILPHSPPTAVLLYLYDGDVDRLRASYSLQSSNHNVM